VIGGFATGSGFDKDVCGIVTEAPTEHSPGRARLEPVTVDGKEPASPSSSIKLLSLVIDDRRESPKNREVIECHSLTRHLHAPIAAPDSPLRQGNKNSMPRRASLTILADARIAARRGATLAAAEAAEAAEDLARCSTRSVRRVARRRAFLSSPAATVPSTAATASSLSHARTPAVAGATAAELAAATSLKSLGGPTRHTSLGPEPPRRCRRSSDSSLAGPSR